MWSCVTFYHPFWKLIDFVSHKIRILNHFAIYRNNYIEQVGQNSVLMKRKEYCKKQ